MGHILFVPGKLLRLGVDIVIVDQGLQFSEVLGNG